MKKTVSILLLFIMLLNMSGGLFAVTTEKVLKDRDEVIRDNRSAIEKIADFPKDMKEYFRSALVVGMFTFFAYATSIIIKAFEIVFKFTGELLPLLKDFTNPKVWTQMSGGNVAAVNIFVNGMEHLKLLVYVMAYGFLFILFINAVLMNFWTGQDLSKPLLSLVFAGVLIMAFPLIYKTLFYVMGQLSEVVWETVKVTDTKQDIMGTLVNVGTFVTDETAKNGNIVTRFLGNYVPGGDVSANLKAGDSTLYNMAQGMNTIAKAFEERDFLFFVNMILTFLLALMGMLALIEVIALKGAQMINLWVGFFTGMFACVLVASETLKSTFWDWLKKFVQFLSYNILWALVFFLINGLGLLLRSPENSHWKILYFTMIFAGLKLLSKVGGLAEGMMMSRQVMENFGSAMKFDAVIAGAAATKTLSGGFNIAKETATAGIKVANTLAPQGQALARTMADGGTKGFSMDKFKGNLHDVKHEKSIMSQIKSGGMNRQDDYAHDVLQKRGGMAGVEKKTVSPYYNPSVGGSK